MNRSKIAEIEAHATSSNDPLSDAEQSVIRELLSEAESFTKSMHKDISRFQLVISSLQQQHAEGLARIERLRRGIAPHKKIPPEILSKIFVCTMEGKPLRIPPVLEVPIWSILGVCSLWRKIAIADPIIWSQIHARRLNDLQGLNPLLHDIFSNRGSGGFIEYYPPWVESTQAWEGLSTILSAYHSRLRHIHFVFSNFIPRVSQTPPIRLDRLESVNISFERQYNLENKGVPVTDFFTSAALRKVAISSGGTPLPSEWPKRVLLPWAQLTDLTIDNVPVSAMETILKQCSCLLTCTVQLGWDLMQQNVSLHPIFLEHLQLLCFHTSSDFPSAEYLLDLLTVPALTYLSFGYQEWNKWPYESVLDLVSRSTCSLEVLITPDTSVEEWEILPIMQAMPRLVELHMYTKTCIANSTIDVIRMEGLVPRLRTLHGLGVCSLLSFIGLLESRRTYEEGGDCVGIREASVLLGEDHPDIYEADYISALMSLKEYGVDLEISTTIWDIY